VLLLVVSSEKDCLYRDKDSVWCSLRERCQAVGGRCVKSLEAHEM
jgi:hypothetical protein